MNSTIVYLFFLVFKVVSDFFFNDYEIKCLLGSWELIESDCKDEHLPMKITKSVPQSSLIEFLDGMCVEWEPCCIVLVELVRYGVRTGQPRSIVCYIPICIFELDEAMYPDLSSD